MNILIVDDQKQVVDGILSGVHWSELTEIHNVLYALSSEEARNIILQNTIDILISDIEMPGEDGIALVTWVKEQIPDIQCIFLTSHASFQYAQIAVKLNCVDYILQPVKYEILQTAIEKTIKKIVHMRDESLHAMHNKFWDMNKSDYEKQLWSNYVIGKLFNLTQTIEQFQKLEISPPLEAQYALLLAEDITTKTSLDEWVKNEPILRFSELLNDFFRSESSYQCTFYQQDNHLLHLVCTTLRQDEIYSRSQSLLDLCQNTYMINPAIYLSTVNHIKDLPDLYNKLSDLKKMNIAYYSKLYTLTELDMGVCLALPSTQKWVEYFMNTTTDAILSSIEVFLHRNIESKALNMATLLTLQHCFLHEFHNSLQARCINIQKVMEQPELFEAFVSSTKSVEYFIHFVKKVFEVNRTLTDNHNQNADEIIDVIIKYVSDNIKNDLTRQTIAQNVHISESYLSHLFQKKTGITLSNYITEQRMQLAKSMLIETTMPVGLIAIKCGYNHFSYFIRTFKCYYGMSPLEYRNTYS